VFVLKKWQTNLQNRKFESINYLDASLISDMNTIILMYNPQEEGLYIKIIVFMSLIKEASR
jgi:hypothetical protein